MGLILILYFVISVIFTYPLILKLGNFLPGTPNDAYVYLWNIGNFWHQIFEGRNLFFTTEVMYPIGANLFFHTYAPLVSAFALPFLNNLSLYMGLLILFSLTLSAFTAYLFIVEITQNKMAALTAGLIYAFSPIVGSFIESQHYYFLFSSFAYPLGLYFIYQYFKLIEIKYLYFVTILFWIVLGIDYYSAVLFSLLVLVYFALNINVKTFEIKKYLLVFILTILTPFIILFSFEKNFNEFVIHKQVVNSSSTCNTNIEGFITPNINNPFFSMVDQKVNLDTPSYFLGWGILVIAIISIIKNWKIKLIKDVTFIGLFFLLLSFGTNVKYFDSILAEGKYTLFYYFLKLPILGAIDCPIRFPIVIQLCIAILVAFFVASHKKVFRVFIAVFALLIIEYGTTNINFSSTKIPTVYEHLTKQDSSKTLLEIPSGLTESKGAFGYDWSMQALNSRQMYWQTFHKKPKVGIYMSRITNEKYDYFKNETVISDIFNYSSLGGVKPTIDITNDKIKNFIKIFNLGYIIFSPNPRQDEFTNYIDSEFREHIINRQNFEGFIYYEIK
jgi:hypothetical protein